MNFSPTSPKKKEMFVSPKKGQQYLSPLKKEPKYLSPVKKELFSPRQYGTPLKSQGIYHTDKIYAVPTQIKIHLNPILSTVQMNGEDVIMPEKLGVIKNSSGENRMIGDVIKTFKENENYCITGSVARRVYLKLCEVTLKESLLKAGFDEKNLQIIDAVLNRVIPDIDILLPYHLDIQGATIENRGSLGIQAAHAKARTKENEDVDLLNNNRGQFILEYNRIDRVPFASTSALITSYKNEDLPDNKILGTEDLKEFLSKQTLTSVAYKSIYKVIELSLLTMIQDQLKETIRILKKEEEEKLSVTKSEKKPCQPKKLDFNILLNDSNLSKTFLPKTFTGSPFLFKKK